MKKVHFVAIGGQGMSGIARILLDMGYTVTGSDLKSASTTRRLEDMGAKVFIGHRRENIQDPDLVVVSSAINPDNPEVVEAKARGIPVIHRVDMLLSAVGDKRIFAVAGAHGKTTTTSMLAWIFEKHGLDPTYLVGGEFTTEGNAHLGKSDIAVVEMDESDGSFLKARPYLSVVTNIDNDHLDYWGSMEALMDGFYRFLDGTRGFKVLCSRDPLLNRYAVERKGTPGERGQIITYSLEGDSDWSVTDIRLDGFTSCSRVLFRGREVAELRLSVPGLHNIENALGAMAAAFVAGVQPRDSVRHLFSFKGARRRLELIAQTGGVSILDDFAHHPREIKASLSTLKKAFAPGRVLTVFQPHRYSRTKLLHKEFGQAFEDADRVIITGIYAGPGEKPDPSVSSVSIAESVRDAGHPHVSYVDDMYVAATTLAREALPGDAIVTMGAGDIWKTHRAIIETLGGTADPSNSNEKGFVV